MEAVNISELRANLLHYLKRASAGEEIAVTSHGELLATIAPPADKRKTARSRLNRLAKTAALHDVLSPIEGEWDALT